MKRFVTILGLGALLLGVVTLAAAAPAGRAVIAQGVDPTTLDPHNHQETPASVVAQHIYDTLLERDRDTKLKPLLAESYRLVNPTTWEFKLRKGIKFHNGEDMDAEAVKFSLERIVDPELKGKQAPLYRLLDHVEIVDKYTVRILTKQPWVTLESEVAQRGQIIAPKAFRGKDSATVSKNPIGTGPYKFVRWVKDDQLVLEANDQYWRGAPNIKTIVFRPIPEHGTRVAALQTGEVDIAVNIPPHLVRQVQADPKLFVSTAPSVRTIFIPIYTVNTAEDKSVRPIKGATADRRVRQAMNHAVNVEAIIRDVLEGQGLRTPTMLTEQHFGFEPALKPYPHDPERAKKLLAEAGYPNGFDLVLNSPDGRYIKDKEVAEAVAGQLSKVGIRAQVKTHEWGTYLNKMVYVHKADPMYLIGWGNATWDADASLYPLFHAGEPLANFSHPDFDKLIEAARVETDRKRREELYHKASRILYDEAGAIFLYRQMDLYGVSKRLNWQARSDERMPMYEASLKGQ